MWAPWVLVLTAAYSFNWPFSLTGSGLGGKGIAGDGGGGDKQVADGDADGGRVSTSIGLLGLANECELIIVC